MQRNPDETQLYYKIQMGVTGSSGRLPQLMG